MPNIFKLPSNNVYTFSTFLGLTLLVYAFQLYDKNLNQYNKNSSYSVLDSLKQSQIKKEQNFLQLIDRIRTIEANDSTNITTELEAIKRDILKPGSGEAALKIYPYIYEALIESKKNNSTMARFHLGYIIGNLGAQKLILKWETESNVLSFERYIKLYKNFFFTLLGIGIAFFIFGFYNWLNETKTIKPK